MASVPRCFVADTERDPVALDRASRHHLERVLRLQRDDALELVDGRGGWARARWVPGGDPRVEERIPRRPPDTAAITLAVAPPRPSRLDWLVEKAAELGVARLLLLDSEHAARSVGAARCERLQRKAEQAMLQSRRLHALQVRPPTPLTEVLRDPPSGELWLARPPSLESGGIPARNADAPLLVLVGPEGGFTAEEERLADSAGARPVSVGDGVLRVETAALALTVLALAASDAGSR